ncbi:unnamed protein product, partial [Effrenium voratum]
VRCRGRAGKATHALDRAEGEAPEDLREKVLAGLGKACQSTEGKISGLQRQLRDPAEAEIWRARGNGLLQVQAKWHQGMTEVSVPDYSRLGDDGLPLELTVELDPKKDFKQNAKLCFKQASKIERAVEKCTPLLEAEEQNLQRFQAELAQLQGVASLDEEVERLYEELLEEGFIRKPKPKKVVAQVPADTKWKRKYGQ